MAQYADWPMTHPGEMVIHTPEQVASQPTRWLASSLCRRAVRNFLFLRVPVHPLAAPVGLGGHDEATPEEGRRRDCSVLHLDLGQESAKMFLDLQQSWEQILLEVILPRLFTIVSCPFAPILHASIPVPDSIDMALRLNSVVAVNVPAVSLRRIQRTEICLYIVHSSIEEGYCTPIWVGSSVEKFCQRLVKLGLLDVVVWCTQRVTSAHVDKIRPGDVYARAVSHNVEVKLNISTIAIGEFSFEVVNLVPLLAAEIVHHCPHRNRSAFAYSEDFGHPRCPQKMSQVSWRHYTELSKLCGHRLNLPLSQRKDNITIFERLRPCPRYLAPGLLNR